MYPVCTKGFRSMSPGTFASCVLESPMPSPTSIPQLKPVREASCSFSALRALIEMPVLE